MLTAFSTKDLPTLPSSSVVSIQVLAVSIFPFFAQDGPYRRGGGGNGGGMW